MRRQTAQGLVHHLPDRAQRVLGRNPLLQVDVAEHSALLLLISTHATYITYLACGRRVPSEIPPHFSAASEAGGTRRLESDFPQPLNGVLHPNHLRNKPAPRETFRYIVRALNMPNRNVPQNPEP